MATMIHNAVHLLVAFALPSLLLGIINRTKAMFAGRNGPPLLQPYYDLNRLFRKGSVFSTTTTWVFRAGPVVGLVTAALAVLMIPLGDAKAPISFTGDLILLVYLLGLSRFFTASAAVEAVSVWRVDRAIGDAGDDGLRVAGLAAVSRGDVADRDQCRSCRVDHGSLEAAAHSGVVGRVVSVVGVRHFDVSEVIRRLNCSIRC